jgi:predicted enzyme related to lactoylglutathione lyase
MKKLIEWVEIPSADFERAVKFYSSLLGVTLDVHECESEKMACLPGNEGAVVYADGYEPSRQGVVVSFNVGDGLDAAIRRVTEAGGEMVLPRTKIEAPGRDYFALFRDSEGNRMGLYGL